MGTSYQLSTWREHAIVDAACSQPKPGNPGTLAVI